MCLRPRSGSSGHLDRQLPESVHMLSGLCSRWRRGSCILHVAISFRFRYCFLPASCPPKSARCRSGESAAAVGTCLPLDDTEHAYAFREPAIRQSREIALKWYDGSFNFSDTRGKSSSSRCCTAVGEVSPFETWSCACVCGCLCVGCVDGAVRRLRHTRALGDVTSLHMWLASFVVVP